ncbi:hypothetical protein P0136_10655 [Lentisphaerota bacterium ZTH]|nr:hypothetical protein JYG24_11830 [Lentisphaerota bacterium]WET05821.1 hypothetical protein P0136_10655 [Lentisphaerota bacterium ZTH]
MSNFKQFCTAIEMTVKEEFKSDQVCVRWLESADKELPAPAILLDIEQLDIGVDAGDGRLPLECSLCAFCVMSVKTPSYELAVKGFAARLMKLLRHNNFKIDAVTLPKNITAEGVDFSPGKAGYICWAVTWQQTVYVGEDVWNSATIMPTEVKFRLQPDGCATDEDDYESL